MRSLFSSSIANVTGLFVLAWSFMLAETFTEAIRVYQKRLPGSPVNRLGNIGAPEGPLLIVATITEQVAYV